MPVLNSVISEYDTRGNILMTFSINKERIRNDESPESDCTYRPNNSEIFHSDRSCADQSQEGAAWWLRQKGAWAPTYHRLPYSTYGNHEQRRKQMITPCVYLYINSFFTGRPWPKISVSSQRNKDPAVKQIAQSHTASRTVFNRNGQEVSTFERT